MVLFKIRTILLNILIGSTHAATSDCVVFRNSMKTTFLIYNCVSNTQVTESPALCEVRSVMFFCQQGTRLLQSFNGKFVKHMEILSSLKAKCVVGQRFQSWPRLFRLKSFEQIHPPTA